jgi:4-aminobutyrate aminotransferase-like enzyme
MNDYFPFIETHLADSLIAHHLMQDPRIAEGTRRLIDVVQEHQKELTGIRPPQQTSTSSYDDILNAFQDIRGIKLFFPYLGSGCGRGPLVELLDGSVKYDMICGIGTHFWGHSHPPLIEAALNGALSDTIMQGNLQQNHEAFTVSQLLVRASGLDHCFLSSSGAMANENALKIAFQKKFPAHRLLTFDHCFMGRTLTLSQITDKPNFREGLPFQLPIDYLPFYQPSNPEGSTQQTLKLLHQYLDRYPNQYAAMCFELIQGEAGIYPGSASFFSSIMQVLKDHNIAIIVDEVQTFGRTPQLFAYQYFQLEHYVDIVSVGKLCQVCATLFRSSFKPQAGLLSQTFISSSTALQGSEWIIRHLLSDDFFGPNGKLTRLYSHFEQHFKRLEKRWPDRIQGPYGIGGMIVFTPFGGENQRVIRFVQDLFQAGVIAFTAGSHPTRVRFLIPAGVLTFEDIDTVMSVVEQVLNMADYDDRTTNDR